MVQQDTFFTVSVVDPCTDGIQSIQAGELVNQEYTITDEPKSYQFSQFSVEPDWCDIIYSYSLENNSIQQTISFDETTRTFTFSNEEDIHLAGESSSTYVITITGSAGTNTVVSESSSFDLQLNNPCNKGDYITISDP